MQQKQKCSCRKLLSTTQLISLKHLSVKQGSDRYTTQHRNSQHRKYFYFNSLYHVNPTSNASVRATNTNMFTVRHKKNKTLSTITYFYW